jgi:cell division protein FtsB
LPYLPEKRKIPRKRVRIYLPHPVIHLHGAHHWGWLLIAVFFTVVLAYLGWKVYRLGDNRLVHENRLAILKTDELEERIERIAGERDALRQQVASLERSAQIDREAARQLKEELEKLQRERLELKEELTLLETVTSGKTPGTSLRVSRFKITRMAQKQHYRYAMTAMLLPELEDPVSATVSIRLSGTTLDGEGDEMNLLELGEKKQKSRSITFKHLQMLEGEFRLPDDFEPDLVTIDITTSNEDIKNLSRSFPWEVF